MRIEDLGKLDGQVLLFGGIYSNLQALTALWARADRLNIPESQRICTGDIAAYCADAGACVAFVMDARSPVLKGNCEEQLASGALDCGCGFDEGSTCSLLSVRWYEAAQAQMTDAMRKYMAELPDRMIFEHAGKRYVTIHGGAGDISRFLWTVTPDAMLREEIATLRGQVGDFDAVVAGHSGLPFERQVDGVHWINAGAIGMPAHDLSAKTHFAVLTDGRLAFHRLTYDAAKAQARMIELGLTQGYHSTLLSGVWPSEDTLPTELHHCDIG